MTRYSDMIRLENTFEELAGAGLITEHNFWCCGGCAVGFIAEKYDKLSEAQSETTIGFAFYHEQDAERAIDYKIMLIRFGSLPVIEDGGRGDDKFIGEMIVRYLREHGFTVEWDGDPNTAICIPDFSVTLEEMPYGEGSKLHENREEEEGEGDDYEEEEEDDEEGLYV